MAAEPPQFQPGQSVIVTRPCLGVPALSVGVITKIYSANPPLYLIHFGAALPDGPLPETVLSRLQLVGAPN